MKFKFILPALTEAESPFWRPIKYSLFPPLGLATLANLSDTDEAEIVDQHVQQLVLDDQPDVVAIQVYITNAYRAYKIADAYRAKGVFVILGGLHVTSLSEAIVRSSLFHGSMKHQLKHFSYTSGWKKFEPLWNLVIQCKRLGLMTPLLEAVLSKVTSQRAPDRARDHVSSPTESFSSRLLPEKLNQT